MKLPTPIREPYTPLFMAVRERCSARIEEMDAARGGSVPGDRQLVTEEWEEYDPGLVIATVEFEQARIVLSWGVDDEDPVRASRSPEYVVDLGDLDVAARATEHPRRYFDSHAAAALHEAQHYLIEFFRDGPTDDIPFERHLIVIHGTEFSDRGIPARDIVVTWERQAAEPPGGHAAT